MMTHQLVLAPTLRGYRRSWLAPDIVAGLSAGAVVIPQGMAYATIASLPVQIGLFTCIVPMLVYAALGGSKAMSVSSTSTIATLTATTLVTAGVAVGSDDALRDLVTLTFLVGAILLLARLFSLGALVENISSATLIGIKVGVGATVAVGQLPKLFGVDTNFTGHGFIRSIVAIVESLPGASIATIVLSVVTLALLLGLRRWAPSVPGSLVAVVLGIALVAWAGLRDAGVETIAPVPSGFPAPGLPGFTDLGALIPGAIAIAVMAFLESAAVARGIRQAGDPQIDSNRELFAAGAASLVGAFFHTMPAAGGFSQSAVSLRAGARSQVASIVTAALAVLVALFLGPVLSNLPQATLAAMVIVAVVPLIDIRGLVRLARINPPEFWISLATALVGLSAGLLPAVAVGVGLTIILVLRELNRPRISILPSGRADELVIRLDGALYTANVLGTLDAIERAVTEATTTDGQAPSTLVLDCTALVTTSVTVLDTLADTDHDLAGRGIRLVIAGLPPQAATIAERTEWYPRLQQEGRVVSSITEG